MFGKSLAQYVAFQRPWLILIAVVWALRLGFSMANLPVASGKYVSISLVLWIAAAYYGWAVGRHGFGSFKQLYALNLIQSLFSQTLVALAIVVGIATGQDNIYTIPEFYPPSQGGTPLPPDGKNFVHAAAHVVVAGAVVIPIITWILSALVHLLTRRSTRPA